MGKPGNGMAKHGISEAVLVRQLFHLHLVSILWRDADRGRTMIDVTRCSIEETAAAIQDLYRMHRLQCVPAPGSEP